MNDGSQFIDIIFFAMVAIFIGLRLRSVLGRRTGNERPLGRPPEQASPDVVDNKVVELNRHRNFDSRVFEGPAAQGLARISAADRSFSPDYFVNGASAAFEMIVTAFARGDEETLKPLLAPPVMANFSQAIAARQSAGEYHEIQVLHIGAAEIVEAALDGRSARIKVRFASQQTHVVKDGHGTITDGDAERILHVTDLWTFTRDISSANPNWLLSATESVES